MIETETEETTQELDVLLRVSVQRIVKGSSPDAFLEWFAHSAPMLAPRFFGVLGDDPAARRGALITMGRLLWNRTPLPENRFRPRPLPKPERNAPCPCGSGRKYKQCCVFAESLPDPFQDLSILRYVLETMPAGQYKDLPFAHLDPQELAHIADTWREEGRAGEAAKLLEPLLAHPDRLDERAELAFDSLVECYNTLDKPRKKQALIEAFLSAPNRTLRGAALARQATMLADQNRYDEAWRLFGEAQRLQPDNPHLCHLEITLLHAQGRVAEARERARFWIARLSNEKFSDYHELTRFLREYVADPDGFVFRTAAAQYPFLEQMQRLLQTLPEPGCLYCLQPERASAGPLEPKPELAALIAQWRAVFPDDESEALAEASVLQWLQNHPGGFDSFEIVEDVLVLMDELNDGMGGVDKALTLPLLKRTEALLRRVLKENGAEGKQLEYGWLENRPALRLMARLVQVLETTGDYHDAARVAEWMVLSIDPDDSLGLRDWLSRLYLLLDQPEKVVDLAARYPKDFATLSYNHALALFRLGRLAQAHDALRDARGAYPEVLRMLLAKNPRKPRITPGFVTVGGKDEAWLYLSLHGELWRKGGALDWARTHAKG